MIIQAKFIESASRLPATFVGNSQNFSANMGEIHTVTKYVGGEEYKGVYEVTPRLEAQTLPTKDKVLTDNVTVKEIEIHRVKNSSGGTTIYIARGA